MTRYTLIVWIMGQQVFKHTYQEHDEAGVLMAVRELKRDFPQGKIEIIPRTPLPR